MKNLAKKSGMTKVEIDARNLAREKFNEFMKNVKEKQAKLDAEVEAKRKAKSPTLDNFNLTDNVLLEIFNAGADGITVGELMTKTPKHFYNYVKDANKEKIKDEEGNYITEQQLEFSIDTIARDWNKQNCLIQYRQQKYNEKNLFVPFKITETPKAENLTCSANNRIAIEDFDTFGPIVKDYLLKVKNFNPDWLKA